MNNFGCRHSQRLQEHFDIEGRGVDYFNEKGFGFEFKESHAKDKSTMFFKLPKIQLQCSDFIVFCVHHNEFFIHKSVNLLGKYSFDNPQEHACLRYTTIRKNYFKKFNSYLRLKKFIEEGHE